MRAFFLALSAGDGASAANYVVPEKRVRGPLSAEAMTKFYRGLTEPLSLKSLDQIGDNLYMARYTFRNGNMVCNGRSEVTTLLRGDENLIKQITALDGC